MNIKQHHKLRQLRRRKTSKGVFFLCLLLGFGTLASCQAKAAHATIQPTTLFEFPSTTSKAIKELKSGTKVDLVFSYQDWCWIKTKETEYGYVLCSAIGVAPKVGSLSNKTIVLDAGHGGSESGAYYFNTAEKDINKKIADYVSTYLEENGINVIQTRKGDETIRLYTRASIANLVGLVSLYLDPKTTNHSELEPLMRELQDSIALNQSTVPSIYRKLPLDDSINPTTLAIMKLLQYKKDIALISIHNNSTLESALGTRGLELILTGNHIASKYPGYELYDDDARTRLRDHLKANMVKEGRIPFHASYFGNYAILRESNLPSIIIEVGFINNEDDIAFLEDDAYQQMIAKDIANGIVAWFANQ